MPNVIHVVRKSTCETCFHYASRSSTFGICRFGGPAVIQTVDRGYICGNHNYPQFALPGIHPTPLPKGDPS